MLGASSATEAFDTAVVMSRECEEARVKFEVTREKVTLLLERW